MSDTSTINGLHRCQPKNEPVEGEVKTFLVIHNPAKNGKKAWIAIKGAPEEKGGTPYRVVSVQSTGWEPDQYGNESYNLEVESTTERPANEPQGTQNAFSSGNRVETLDQRQKAIIRQHSQSMSLEVLKLKATLNELNVEDLTPAKLKSLADYFDADVYGAAQ